MLHFISWPLFFTVIGIAALVYLSVVGILYYPKELLSLVFKREPKSVPGPLVDKGTDPIPAVSREQENWHAERTEGQPVQSNSQDGEASRFLLIGSVADLTNSIKDLFRVVDDSAGTKEDLMPLLKTLLAKYPTVANSEYRYSVNSYIHERSQAEFPGEISPEDINALWP